MRFITSGRRPAQVGIALAITLVLSGCGNKVLMAGDSVTVGAATSVEQKLTALGWDTTVDGRVGRPTDEVLSVIKARRGDSNVFIVEAGYNDSGTPGIFRSRMAAIFDELSNADIVIAVTLNESRSYYATANGTIRDLASTHPNVTVADWAAVTRATAGLVGGDGIHLTTAGATAMAQLLADTLGPAL